MNNNIIIKKLRTALTLNDHEIKHIVELSGYIVSKSEITGILNGENHKNYRKCSDELLLAFLEGMIIFYRDSNHDYLTTEEVAAIEKVIKRRVQAKVKQGHYKHAKRCQCGHGWLIPESDVKEDLERMEKSPWRKKCSTGNK